MRSLLIALGVTLLGTVAAPATEYPTSRCSFTAFVAAPDPEGINLRAGPGFSYGIVGRLPPRGHHAEDKSLPAMVEVEVLDAKDGWFQIRNAKDNVELTGKPARKLHRGYGWISGNKLTVNSQSSIARSQPQSRSRVVARDDDGGPLLDIQGGHRLLDCKGGWVKVEFGEAKARRSGWVDKLCPLQETTCSGT